MVTLSLDTSGEHLHKRGYAIYRGEAPLRETIAGCMIRYLKEQVNIDANLTLLDPFVGSGTLLFEAISCNQPNLNRHYSWLGFKNAPKLFQSATWQKNFRWFDNQNTPDCFGYDIDENAIANLEKNITEFENVFKDCKLSIKFEVKDSRNINLERSKLNKNSWLIANPPYGIRLAEDNAKEIIESLENIVDGVIILHPTHWNFNFKKLKLLKSDEFSNQGLNLKLSVYKTKISNI
jgi:putative N6-adenine-specific DNA methylase